MNKKENKSNKQVALFSEEVEKTVLGDLIIFKDTHRYVNAINIEDFFDTKNKNIFAAIYTLYKKKTGINIISVKEQLINLGCYEENVMEYLTKLTDYAITSSNIDFYITKLKNYSVRRGLIAATKKINEKVCNAENDVDALEIKKECLQEIAKIQTQSASLEDSKIMHTINETLENIEKKFNKQDNLMYRTGFLDLDKVTDGLHEQEFNIIAARPGIGKTAFGLQIAMNIARRGTCVYFASLEMSNVQIGNRLISNESGIDGHKLRMGWLEDGDYDRISKAAAEIADLNLILDTKSTTIQEIETKAIELRETKKLGLIIIDYLQLLKSKDKYGLREQEVADISRRLKLLSRDLDIPVIALCQLNRETEKRKRPILADLRESGSLEQDADNVIFLHAEEEEKVKQIAMNMSVIIAKQRNGATGEIKMRFNKRIMQFQNMIS